MYRVCTGLAISVPHFVAARLAKFQVPRLWEFRDSLPKTPTQRIEKCKLREGGGPLLG